MDKRANEMTSYFEKWHTLNLKNLTLLNQPNDSSHTALKSEISENGSDRYHFWRKGRTGTILGERVEQVPFPPPPKSELAQMNSTLELFLNLALSRAK